MIFNSPSNDHQVLQWFWQSGEDPWEEQDDTKYIWTAYSAQNAYSLEKAFIFNESVVDLGDYEVDLTKMLQVNKQDNYKVRRVKRAAVEQSRFLLDVPEPVAIVQSQKTMNHAFGNIHHFLNHIIHRTQQSYKLYFKLSNLTLSTKKHKYQEIFDEVVACIQKGAETRAKILKIRSASGWQDNLKFEAECIAAELVRKSDTLKGFLKAILRVYTMETFLYSWINELLRNENWKELNILTPFLVCLAYVFKSQEFLIKRSLYKTFTGLMGFSSNNELTLYRGAALLEEHFVQYDLKKIQHFSWNGITSTSLSEEQAKEFVAYSLDVAQQWKEAKRGVMFIISADFNLAKDCEGIIDVSSISKYPHEKEVILSPGSVFELLNIKEGKDGIWNIYLKLIRSFDDKDRVVPLLGDLQKTIIHGDAAIFNSLSRDQLIKASVLFTGNQRITKLLITSCVMDVHIIKILGDMWRSTNIKPKDIVLKGNKIHVASLILLHYHFGIEDLYQVCWKNTIICHVDERERICWVVVSLRLRQQVLEKLSKIKQCTSLIKEAEAEAQTEVINLHEMILDLKSTSGILECIHIRPEISSVKDHEELLYLRHEVEDLAFVQHLTLNFSQDHNIMNKVLISFMKSIVIFNSLQHLRLNFSSCLDLSQEIRESIIDGCRALASLEDLSVSLSSHSDIFREKIEEIQSQVQMPVYLYEKTIQEDANVWLIDNSVSERVKYKISKREDALRRRMKIQNFVQAEKTKEINDDLDKLKTSNTINVNETQKIDIPMALKQIEILEQAKTKSRELTQTWNCEKIALKGVVYGDLKIVDSQYICFSSSQEERPDEPQYRLGALILLRLCLYLHNRKTRL